MIYFPTRLGELFWKPIESSLELQGGYFAYKTTGPACEALVFPFLSQCWWKKCCIAWIFHKNLAYQLPVAGGRFNEFPFKSHAKDKQRLYLWTPGHGKIDGFKALACFVKITHTNQGKLGFAWCSHFLKTCRNFRKSGTSRHSQPKSCKWKIILHKRETLDIQGQRSWGLTWLSPKKHTIQTLKPPLWLDVTSKQTAIVHFRMMEEEFFFRCGWLGLDSMGYITIL